MRIVLDASVAVAAVSPSEARYRAARRRIERCHRGDDVIVVPSFFLVEVSGALARRGAPAQDIRSFVDALTASPHEVVTVGPRAARAARAIAIVAKLRGPDALYVWLARREAIALCTLDTEMSRRATGRCTLVPP
jgi:predicted nucleic acid-binding protein